MDPMPQSTVLRAVIQSHVDKQADWISLAACPSASQTLAHALAVRPVRTGELGPRTTPGLTS